MSELFEIKPKLCLELEFDDVATLNGLSFNAKTEVLGGRVTRIDFEGDTFNENDFYRELLDGDQISFLLARNRLNEAKNAISLALKKLIEEIEFDEYLNDGEKEIM
ncbi:Uncharacterised protein [Actinobacillus pleuropneumoniae]|uniref:hypothetical protein n=1 Tax=Actinobacillus pleuropneumoniae TaxID=715 RepID=UPI0001E4A4B7|nr:hypothetical protein [Actinobacillus pleuropneumoniae]EFM88707.1 hypothetical protein appser4_21530 [Actinobacillus pleuropneumoniae serovar 4 str. M62]UKH42080.1 hypothetical protein D1097_10125 [Actinobacillus pleuropneumoniae serovar 4 str. M62]SQF65679.1 Uncharacterised protein [Actinobacillus pleuropneumoniae]